MKYREIIKRVKLLESSMYSILLAIENVHGKTDIIENNDAILSDSNYRRDPRHSIIVLVAEYDRLYKELQLLMNAEVNEEFTKTRIVVNTMSDDEQDRLIMGGRR